MTPERMQQVEELYHAALRQQPDQRAAFLSEACGSDPELLEEVASLISANDHEGSFIDASAYDAALDIISHAQTAIELRTDDVVHRPENKSGPAEKPLPERLSGHKILGEIGEGGMGRVLLGLDEGLGRKVAIKTLNSRFADNPVLRARFMHEARAMARLSHRNIARIYNLGQQDEIPHFVMEYLEGTPLTTAAERLTIRQKVEIMHTVVLAVDFLHQHQVIHRDLKPGNILVGPDLEPKVLDFGLALHTDLGKRFTLPGEVMGTPDYFSPEQARADASLDARSDLFALGTILYELLTGVLPFRGTTISEQIDSICDSDPVLPRRINPAISGDLQNICMKALEKQPEHRYASAREMADDLGRFITGEPVLAIPASYARLISGKIDLHLRELDGWKRDRILSNYEFDSFRKLYDRLVEREDAWIMEVRRLSLPQVSLYFGAWLLVMGGALVVLFHYVGLSELSAVLVVTAAAIPTGYLGIRSWKRGRLRISLAYLLAFCLLLPISLLVLMNTLGVFNSVIPDRELYSLFPSFKKTTNSQLWWSLLISLPAYVLLRRFTKAAVFSLVLAVFIALFSLATLLQMGLIEWFSNDPGKVYLYLIPIGVLFFGASLVIERLGHGADSRYFYPFAVAFTLIGLSGVAAVHKPYADWLGSIAPVTRGQVEYLFIINAGIYLALQYLCERLATPQMRTVAQWFRFVIPGHIMTSLWLLGIAASNAWEESPTSGGLQTEARVFEILLPAVACTFIFISIPKQMKNFFAVGLLFLGIGVVRLQQDLLKDRAAWPIALLVAGFLLMLAAANYSTIVRYLGGLMRKRNRQ